MKFSISSLLLLIFTIASCAYASPVSRIVPINEEPLLTNTHQLAEGALQFPLKCTSGLQNNVLAAVKADLHDKVFGNVTTSFCEQTGASLDISATLLGRNFNIGDAKIKAIVSAVVKNLKTTIDAELNALLVAQIYNKLQLTLRDLLAVGSIIPNEAGLLTILENVETTVKAVIKTELSNVGAALTLEAKKQIDVAINNVEVNVPALVHVAVTANINVNNAINTIINTALRVCDKLDAVASAKAILQGL